MDFKCRRMTMSQIDEDDERGVIALVNASDTLRSLS
jgi:hypothetical protein